MTQFYSKNRIVSLFIMLLAATTVMMAAPRTLEQAQQAAMQQMKKHSSKKAQGISGVTTPPKLIYSKAKKNAKVDEVAYYVFSYGNDLGYTIVSGDDRLPAIVGYTDNGNYDVENLPTNLKSFMQDYQDFAETATDEQIAEIKAWKANATSHPAVAPFMKEKWNQGEPYNNMCPEGPDYGRSLTGCVATAVAQILHYYKYPTILQTDIPEYITYYNEFVMPGITAGEQYDWFNMLDIYTGSETNYQKDAVAKLMLHVGCAVEMDYDPDGSSANATSETFTKYFGMDKDLVRSCDRANYEIAQWDELLYKEMGNKRPVYYRGGTSRNEGHAFVIHGYEDGLYYVNWGWGGYCDGYFDITILNPHSNQGAGASSSEDGYSRGNGMIIGIQPDNGEVDNIPSSTISSIKQLEFSSTPTVSQNTLSGEVAYSPKNINLHGTKYVSIGYKETNGKYKNIGSATEINSEYLPIGYFYKNVFMKVSFEFEEGNTYTLCLIESNDNNNWIACAGENTTALNIKVENGKYQVVDYNYALTTTVQLNKTSSGYAKKSNTIDITVNNTGDKEYYDIVYIKVNTTGEKPDNPNYYIYATGITAPINGSTSFNFTYTPETTGKYYFWIFDKDGNLIPTEQNSIEFTNATGTAPELSFSGIKCANASNDVLVDYNNKKINKVNDTKAVFEFDIKNDGGYYEGEFQLWKYDATQKGWPFYRIMPLKIPASSTTTFTFTADGNIGDVVGYKLQSNNNKVTIKGLTNANALSFDGGIICYLAGSPEYTRDVNTTTGKWNTICLPFDCNIPSGITVEEFAGIEGNKVMFTPVTTTMTAGKPYIFKANGSKVEFKNSKGEAAEDWHTISSNCEVTKDNATFVGVWYNTVTFNEDFRKNGNYTYYGINPATNEFQELTETAICTPYHAYLKVENPANGARALAIVHGDDNTTGISDVNNAEQKQVIYNLNGQRINSPQKGINIINGRKVIIK